MGFAIQIAVLFKLALVSSPLHLLHESSSR